MPDTKEEPKNPDGAQKQASERTQKIGATLSKLEKNLFETDRKIIQAQFIISVKVYSLLRKTETGILRLRL